MSETTTRPVSGLSAMKLDELKTVATSMGIKGTAKMRKSDLVEAIKARQSGGELRRPRAPRRPRPLRHALPAGQCALQAPPNPLRPLHRARPSQPPRVAAPTPTCRAGRSRGRRRVVAGQDR